MKLNQMMSFHSFHEAHSENIGANNDQQYIAINFLKCMERFVFIKHVIIFSKS